MIDYFKYQNIANDDLLELIKDNKIEFKSFQLDNDYSTKCNFQSLENIEIDDNINYLQNNQFQRCTNLQNIHLSIRLQKLPISCFELCTQLTNINFNECTKLTYIDGWAFSACNSLIKVVLPKYLEILDDYAFNCCANLEEIQIPNTVHKIGEGCFYRCKSLKNVNLPLNLIKIKENCFYNCSNLTKIIIPVPVKYIEQEAFSECHNLEEVEFLNKNENEKINLDIFAFKNTIKLIKINLNKCIYNNLTFKYSLVEGNNTLN